MLLKITIIAFACSFELFLHCLYCVFIPKNIYISVVIFRNFHLFPQYGRVPHEWSVVIN